MEKLLSTGFYAIDTEEFIKFTKGSCKLIDWNKTLNSKFASKVKFYDYKNVVLHEYLLGGHFKSKNARIDHGIIIATFPKTGSSWCQEIAHLVLHRDDLFKSDAAALIPRVPFLELLGPLTVEDINKMPNPKLLKTHVPYSIFSEDYADKNYKVIYITRNPKDTVVSFYFFARMNTFYQYQGTLGEFVDLFVNDLVPCAPFPKHVLEFWEKSKTQDNILFLQYEELQQDLKSGIRKVGEFLQKDLSESEVEAIANRCSFASMSDTYMVTNSHLEGLVFDSNISKFMRKGKVGDWKNHLSEEDNKKMDLWIEKNFGNSDLKFIYE